MAGGVCVCVCVYVSNGARGESEVKPILQRSAGPYAGGWHIARMLPWRRLDAVCCYAAGASGGGVGVPRWSGWS